MEPLPVVKDFDPLKDGSLGFPACGKLATMHQLPFQTAPEAFHRGVVIAVARSAHAGDDARLRQAFPVSGARILHPAIGVMHQSCRGPALFQRHVQRGQRQGGGQTVAHRPGMRLSPSPRLWRTGQLRYAV